MPSPLLSTLVFILGLFMQAHATQKFDWCLITNGTSKHVDLSHTQTSEPWLFIWSTGRSGSTTLLDMVNLLPGVHLTGENRMTEPAMNLWDSWYMRMARRSKGKSEDGASQRNTLDFDKFRAALQAWFAAITPLKAINNSASTKIIKGWKDVHFRPENARFLQEVFPCSRFIFNIRSNVSQQALSGHFKNQVNPQTLQNRNEEIYALHSKIGPEASYLMALEDFSPTSFSNLFTWLGFPNCTPTKLIHSNSKGWTADRTTDKASILPATCATLL